MYAFLFESSITKSIVQKRLSFHKNLWNVVIKNDIFLLALLRTEKDRRETMKKRLILFLLLLMALMLIPTVGVAAKKKPKLNKKKITLTVDGKFKLKVKNTKAKVKWKSSNKKIATVNKKGKVVAKKAGKATIYAKVKKKKLKCTVRVKRIVVHLKSIKEGEELPFKASEKYKYVFNFTPTESGVYEVEGKSDGGKFEIMETVSTESVSGEYRERCLYCTVFSKDWCGGTFNHIFSAKKTYELTVVIKDLKKQGLSSMLKMEKTDDQITNILLNQEVELSYDYKTDSYYKKYYSFTPNESGYYKFVGTVNIPNQTKDDWIELDASCQAKDMWYDFKNGTMPSKEGEHELKYYVQKGETSVFGLEFNVNYMKMKFKVVKTN